MQRHEYRALVDEVEDGDTVVLFVDLDAFHVWARISFRLVGIAARERKEPGGEEARANLEALLPKLTPVTVRSKKPDRPIPPDKYGGRWDGVITLPDGVDLGGLLVMTHWAAVWNGKGPQPKPPWPRPV